MLVVVASYRQNVHAYPSGGGDYEVATVNLGPNAGLTVASALLVDYVLTVAVSISSGVQNAKSVLARSSTGTRPGRRRSRRLMLDGAEPARRPGVGHRLRHPDVLLHGRRSSAWSSTGCSGSWSSASRSQAHSAQYGIEPDPQYAAFTGFAMVALLARAFSSGCAALTGVEAISNGVPAFKKPKSKNAATTLLLLGTIAVTMLIGVIALANLTGLKLIDAGRLATTRSNGQRVDVVEQTGDRPAGRRGLRRLHARLLLRRSSPP